MVTYRRATASDRAKILDFINMVFSMTVRPHDFSTLIPKVYGPGRGLAEIHCIALDDNDAVRGVVAALPQEIHILDQTLRTAFVGSVSVHPYARGEGHMKALMTMMIDDEQARGADLIALGGQRQRYQYFGLTPGGSGITYMITRANLRHTAGDLDVSGFSFLPMHGAPASLSDAAWALHEAQSVRMERPRESFESILENWQSTPYILEKDGAFAGYLTASGDEEGLGELRLVDAKDLRAALKAWFAFRQIPRLSMTVPVYDLALNRELKAIAESFHLSTTQRVRVFNFPNVIRAYLALNAALRPIADGELSLWIDGQPLTARVERGAVTVTETAPTGAAHLTAMEAQERLFSPLAAFDGPFAPSGWLPLPLFIGAPDEF